MTREELREAQAALGMTRAELAAAIGVSFHTVRAMLKGQRAVTERTAITVGLLLSTNRRRRRRSGR